MVISTANAQSLDSVIQQSLFDNPQVHQAYDNYVTRTHQIDVARAGYMPKVDAVAGVGAQRYKDQDSAAVSSSGSELGLTLTQMLFDGFSTSNNVDRTSSEAEAQKYTLLAQANNTALSISQAYINVLKYQQLLKLAQDNLSTHTAILDDIEKRSTSGVSSSADLVQTKGRVSQAQANVLSAENNLEDAKASFFRLTHLNVDSFEQPIPEMTKTPSDLASAKTYAQKNHPTIISADKDLLATEYQYEASKSNFYPKVTIEASQYRYDGVDGYENTRDSGQVMLRMRYNLFNGGADIAQKRAAASQMAEAKDVKMNALRELDEGLSLAWNAKSTLNKQRQFMDDHVNSSLQTVLAYRKQFLIGNRSLLDVLNTENELFEARQNLVSTTYDEIYSDYRILNATGQLLESIKFKVPASW